MNAILNEGLSHIYELDNIFKGFIDYVFVRKILSYILVMKNDYTHTRFSMHLFLETTLLATHTALVLFLWHASFCSISLININ
jgi:hypothetical protein